LKLRVRNRTEVRLPSAQAWGLNADSASSANMSMPPSFQGFFGNATTKPAQKERPAELGPLGYTSLYLP